MLHNDLFLAGVGHGLAPRLDVADAVARGDCDATWAQRCGQLAVRVAAHDTPAPDFAIEAAASALTMADVKPTDVGALTHTFVLDNGIPAVNPAAYVQREIGVPAGSYPITATADGCHGALNAIAAAALYLRADQSRPAALITAADAWPGRIFDRFAPGYDAPLADGGAAAVLTRRQRGVKLRLVATATYNEPALEQLYRGDEPWGSGRLSPSNPLGLQRRIRAYSAQTGHEEADQLMVDTIAEAIAHVLDEANVQAGEVAQLLTPFCRDSVLETMYLAHTDLPPAASRAAAEVGRTIGHIGPADPLVALSYLLRSGQINDGDHVLLVADGGGFSATAVLLQA